MPGLGVKSVQRLLEAFGDPCAALAAPRALLARVVGAELAAALPHTVKPTAHRAMLDWLAQPGNHFLPITDPRYPARLRDIADAPPWLYVKGEPDLLGTPMLAIVGSRHATAQGRRDAAAFARSLAEAGLTIVSGLASGIDTAAHEGALAGGKSVAVVATGLDRVYPASNRELAHRLADQGALVSELPLGTPPRPGQFPRRNRIISGLALGVLVVEATLDSGSLITARLAAEQGREVFALPGSIHSPLSKGCHRLIREGAKLVECVEDVLEELRWQWTPPAANPSSDGNTADAHRQRLLELMGPDPVPLDRLVERSGLTVEDLSAMLLALELDGRVACLPGGLYQRLY
ncbi:MAG: DNA-processing protein DprA [Thiobacillaceae bacterium]|nr:DNA-processing protein DprA [Thiobacillaceae bacterium]MCX7673133.1 DNA-processing protein DprA [Thiobacillaceae bacterium]MDW8323513.1 DNA-processing protein DprA [Burkholderiales bacterium]